MQKVLTTLCCGALVVGGWMGYASLYKTVTPAGSAVIVPEPVVHLPFDSAVIDKRIANNENAVKIDPGAAMNWSGLCSAYLARSRESDDYTTAIKAEESARHSLKIRKLGNSGAWNKLVSSLLQQHRFKDALIQTEACESEKLSDDTTQQLKADCMIEIGRYDDAGLVVSKHPRAFSDGSGKTIVARLLDIGGKPGDALRLLKEAVAEVDVNGGMASDSVAWFHGRLAQELAKTGHHDEARKEFEFALSIYPRDYKSMAGLARLAFQNGNWQETIDWGNRSDAVAQMADIRALVADAYAKLNQTAKAEEGYNRVAMLVGRPSGQNDGMHEAAPAAGTHAHRLDRQYAVFCADHDRDPVGAYAAALRDFEGRQDIYAYDTLGWVCKETGNLSEAKEAISRALAKGTRDAMLYYHAGVIYAGAGDKAKAAGYLRQALAIDPHFDGIFAPKAEALLRTCDAAGRTALK